MRVNIVRVSISKVWEWDHHPSCVAITVTSLWFPSRAVNEPGLDSIDSSSRPSVMTFVDKHPGFMSTYCVKTPVSQSFFINSLLWKPSLGFYETYFAKGRLQLYFHQADVPSKMCPSHCLPWPGGSLVAAGWQIYSRHQVTSDTQPSSHSLDPGSATIYSPRLCPEFTLVPDTGKMWLREHQ